MTTSPAVNSTFGPAFAPRPDHAGRTPARGSVAFHRGDAIAGGHEHGSKLAIARSTADLLGWAFVGEAVTKPTGDQSWLLVPGDTLVGRDRAHRLGVQGPQHLFGGVVPHAFVATKVITHPLVHAAATAPPGWSHEFGARVAGVVLPGISAFTAADAIEAGKRLLAAGAVRIKEPGGIGGAGQHVAHDLAQLRQVIAGLDSDVLARDGLVLERNLNQVRTLSVGQVSVGPWLASYCGTQRLTRNHHGAEVYGGSRLQVVRGGFDELLAGPLSPAQKIAVEQALVYHRAALDCFDGLIASRANYDIAQGEDDAGQPMSGVLEQSWRIGGASGAELAALHAFHDDPSLQVVCASTHEVYGAGAAVPVGARVAFDGFDPKVGRITKYATLEVCTQTDVDP